MYNVIKRDGKLVSFDITKISTAISQAFDACQKQYNQDIVDFLALKVTADFEPKIEDGKISVEHIQDSVESVLIKAGYDDVSKAYSYIEIEPGVDAEAAGIAFAKEQGVELLCALRVLDY